MLTFFTTPKPFRGHLDVIQRNALRSWTLLHPDVEVILFGDDEGAAEAARDLGIRHEPQVRRNEHGTKYLTWIFDRAHDMARHHILCYANCDIILTADFHASVERVNAAHTKFLMAGRRWDTDITVPLDFAQPDWDARVRLQALEANRQRPPQWIDYFVFSRGLFHGNTPSFVIGRPGWDNWLLWHARASGAAVVDASELVVAVHQNHDYGYHPEGEKGVWEGEEAQQNYKLLGDGRHFATLENATYRLTPNGFTPNRRHWVIQGKRQFRRTIRRAWFALLDWTRPLRHALGLRQRQPTDSLGRER